MEEIKVILQTILLSALPILEQKAAIPFALSKGLTDAQAYFYTLLGALLPSPFILLFIPIIFEFLKRFRMLEKIVNWYEKRAFKQGKNIVKYELLGLFLFVAIPIPGTGVWTGSAVAALLGLDFKKSLITVILGAAVCGLVLLLVSKSVIHFIFWL